MNNGQIDIKCGSLPEEEISILLKKIKSRKAACVYEIFLQE